MLKGVYDSSLPSYSLIWTVRHISKLSKLTLLEVNSKTSYCVKNFRYRSKMNPFTPPKHVRGMKILDRQKFELSVQIPTLKINEMILSPVMKYIKKYLFKIEYFKPVQPYSTDSNNSVPIKLVYLNPVIIKSWSDIELSDRENFIKGNVLESSFMTKEVTLTYKNWKFDEILKAILPVDNDNLSSFSAIGHIVHVNLKDHLLEYKDIIGQVILDKVKECKTVVNKVNIIDNTYRNFSMEVICGEHNFQTCVRENKCFFEFDFSKVYWNPRLCTEHERIVDMLNAGDLLFDVFAGVGPFSIPAARKKCVVYANDLNPNSFKWLCHNAKRNKVENNLLKPFNKDGRLFIKEEFGQFLVESFVDSDGSDYRSKNIHLTMNLPALAVEFLDVFKGILKNYDLKNPLNFKEPTVHVYCFATGEDPSSTAKQLVEANLGYSLGKNLIGIYYVRNVSPKKEMMRVSFKLTLFILKGEEIALLKQDQIYSEDYEPQNKIKKC